MSQVVSLVLGPIVAAAHGSMRVTMLAAALSCGIAVAIIGLTFTDGWQGAGAAALCERAPPAADTELAAAAASDETRPVEEESTGSPQPRPRA